MRCSILSVILSFFGAVLVLFQASISLAQAPTTVQLPTFSFFTVNTTVSVPDSGGSYLGGIMRGSDSRRTRGLSPFPLLANRSTSSDRSAAGMSVRAWIHDFHEMDAAMLAGAVRGGDSDPATLKGSALSSSIEKSSAGGAAAGAPLLSVAEIRRQNDLADQAEVQEAAAFFAKAEEYEAAGKPGLAKLNYQRAASREGGELKQRALARIRALARKQDGEKER